MRSSSEEEILVFGGAYAAPTVMDRVVLILIDRNSTLGNAGCGIFSDAVSYCYEHSALRFVSVKCWIVFSVFLNIFDFFIDLSSITSLQYSRF